MNTQTVNTNTARFFLVAAAAVGMLLFLSITPSFGQNEAKRATSRDGLMDTGYLTKADVSDDLDGSEDEYFYKFKAGPGKLTVTLEVDANETNAGAYLDLFSAGNKPILQNMMVQAIDRGSDRASQSVKLGKKQDIVLRIKGIKYGSSGAYTGTYKIVLEGTAVNFNEVVPAKVENQDKKPEVVLLDTVDQNKKPDAVQPEGASQAEQPAQVAPSDAAGQPPTQAPSAGASPTKKPDKVDRAIEKGTAKSKKLLEALNKVKAKIPE